MPVTDDLELVRQLLDPPGPRADVTAAGRHRLTALIEAGANGTGPRRSRPRTLVPRGLDRRAVASRPRRPLAVLAAGVAVAAAVTGVTVTTLAGHPAAPSGNAALRTAILTAFSQSADDIMYVRETQYVHKAPSGAPGGVMVIPPAFAARIWYSPWQAAAGQPVRLRTLLLARPDGTTVSDTGAEFTMPAPGRFASDGLGNPEIPATAAVTRVDYSSRTWWSMSARSVDVPVTPAFIKAEIARGNWVVAGHPRVDGRPAIELTWMPSGDGSGALTLWVDARSYLPLAEQAGSGSGPGEVTDLRFSFLPATAANLAELRVPVPAGFRAAAPGAFMELLP